MWIEILRNVHLRIAVMRTETNEPVDAGKQRLVGFILKLMISIGSMRARRVFATAPLVKSWTVLTLDKYNKRASVYLGSVFGFPGNESGKHEEYESVIPRPKWSMGVCADVSPTVRDFARLDIISALFTQDGEYSCLQCSGLRDSWMTQEMSYRKRRLSG